MNAESRSVRDSLSSPLVREGFVFVFLLVGNHVVAVDARTYASTGAAIPIGVGLVAGVVMRSVIDSDRVSTGTTAAVVVGLFVAGIVGSWALASALFGSTAESARIPGFALAMVAGSLARRVVSAVGRTDTGR